jgi:glycosyltransferase involved in cell wall biosynthesis
MPIQMHDTATFHLESLRPAKPSWRIAYITETYPPDINGVAMTVAKTVETLRSRGHELQLIRPRNATDPAGRGPDPMQEFLVRGAPIPLYKQLKLGLPAKRALIQLWSRRRPDLVHIATEGPLGWSALQAARKLKLPVCTDFRTNFHAYSQYYGLGWLKGAIFSYMKKFHNMAQCTMVPTQDTFEQLHSMGFERLQVVARGVDTQLYSPERRSDALRTQWGASTQTLVLLSIGRLAAEKNLDLVVESYQKIRAAVPDCKLVFVGDGPYRATLEAKCPDAVFAGFRTGIDLAQHYASADVFLFPSLTETFGNVTLEAMSSGLPVVAFEHAAAKELIVSEMHGLLADAHVPHQFVSQALKMATTPALRLHLQSHVRARAMEMGWSSIMEKLESVYSTLSESQDSSPRTQAYRGSYNIV